MSMMRWDPFTETTSLRQAIDQLFENSFIRPGSAQPGGGLGIPVDLLEQGEALVVKASLPGVKPDDVDVQIQQNVLMITGQHREEQERQQGRYLLAERRTGRFSRAITLPVAVDANACEATFADGVLTLHLPKAEQARTKQIPIRTQSQSQLNAGQSPNAAPPEPALAGRG
jgi:HSP20 family protein